MTTYSLVSPLPFARWLRKVRESSELHAADIEQRTYPRPDRCYLADDGLSGFAVTADGELAGVASLVRGRGDGIVEAAIKAGATHLNCFEGHLTDLYARHGFTVTRWENNYTNGDGPRVAYMHLEAKP